jgi:leucyl aminopeptidase
MKIDTSLESNGSDAIAQTTPIIPLHKDSFALWLLKQSSELKDWVAQTGFRANRGNLCYVPGDRGSVSSVLLGMGGSDDYWQFGMLPGKLASGAYRIEIAEWAESNFSSAALAWGLGAYRFERYKKSKKRKPRLMFDTQINLDSVQTQVKATYLVRDLINTPAADMMPKNLAKAVEVLAQQHNAVVNQIMGDELQNQNYPLIHAVGRASHHAPRLIDLTWGSPEAPKLTLVGKGVCFDSGGLDIKPATGMRLMKKDMGGAAHVIGLADMIMSSRLPVRLRVLIPAVENAVSGNAFRPGDVIISRKGISVEIDNTDAEGRLVLCDTLTEAVSESPSLIVDFATLTGAARIALGTELPGFFTNKQGLSNALLTAAKQVGDPVWPLPLYHDYRDMLDSPIADIVNSSAQNFGGAITAALFLKEFIPDECDWIHFDIMAWNIRHRPGRPIGGEAMGMRAMFKYIQKHFGNRSN